MFPMAVALYPPSFHESLEKPYLSVGLSDSGGIHYNNARVIVHKNQIIVGIDSALGPQEALRDNIVFFDVQKPFTRLLTEKGLLVVFAKTGDCGCGSKLRGWNPYGNVVRSKNG